MKNIPQPKILHNVPLPALANTGLTNFEQMKVGDSFVVPLNGERVEEIERLTNNRCRWFESQIKAVFVTRRTECGIGGWRVS